MIQDLTLANRSYRGYDPSRSVSREELLAFVDCARTTPSSVNIQPLKYALVCEKEAVARVQSTTTWAKALAPLTLPYPDKCPPAFIIVCQDLTVSDNLPKFQRDVGIVSQTILLAATEAGLGGCMISNFTADKMKEALSLPDHMVPVMALAIGKPAETIVLVDVPESGKISYYRDENDVHYVPKRALKDIIL